VAIVVTDWYADGRMTAERERQARFAKAFEAGYHRCWGDIVLHGPKAAHGYWMEKLVPWRNHGGGKFPPLFPDSDGSEG